MTLKLQIINDINFGRPILKYAYLDDGANNFVRVINSSRYYYFKTELALIRANIAAIRNSLKKTIVVLGVGEGSKLSGLITPDKNLILVDISAKMLRLAQNRLSRSAVILNTCLDSIEFERFGENTTFLLFGGTLGNFESWPDFLTRLRDGCPKSNIIIGMEFGERKNIQIDTRIYNGYLGVEVEEFVFYPLSLLGFSMDDGYVEVIFNRDLKRIEFYFAFNDKGKETWLANVGMEPPARVLLTIVNKPTREEFFQTTQQLGLQRGQLDCSAEGNSIIELCW